MQCMKLLFLCYFVPFLNCVLLHFPFCCNFNTILSLEEYVYDEKPIQNGFGDIFNLA